MLYLLPHSVHSCSWPSEVDDDIDGVSLVELGNADKACGLEITPNVVYLESSVFIKCGLGVLDDLSKSL